MRDPIDVIGEGGAAITGDDIDTLKRIAQRLRDVVKRFPWGVTQAPEVAAEIHTTANTLACVLANLEGTE